LEDPIHNHSLQKGLSGKNTEIIIFWTESVYDSFVYIQGNGGSIVFEWLVAALSDFLW